MEENKINKVKIKRIIIIVLVIIVVLLLIFAFLHNRNNVVNTDSVINETSIATNNVNESNQSVVNEVETEEKEEKLVWEWQHDIPENHNVNKQALESLHESLDSYPINSEVIVKDGVIIDEYYKEGYDQNSVFTLQSTSKSITSALVGIAIDKGFIEGVDIPISTYFPQISEYGSEYKNQITIRHLLTHTTGLDASDTANWDEWLVSSNWVDYVLDRQAVSRPGTVFNYFTGNTHLLSAIIEKATGKTAYDFGKEYLFDKLNMDSVQCTTDPQGISDGGNGFALDPYDMAKFGQLYLNNGVWEGEQIISSEWIEQSTTLQFDRSSGSADYGYQWWVRTFGEQNYPAYFAQGHAGQYIFVVPDLELVVVFTSNYTGSTSIYWQYMNNIVNACNG